MRRVLMPYTPARARAYFDLRMTECLTLLAVGVYFLTGQGPWDAYVLAVYAVSGAAGLVLSSALRISRIVPRHLSMLGLIGYPVFLAGSILAMFNVVDITHGAGMLALVPGGLFELVLPIWLFTRGFTFTKSGADLSASVRGAISILPVAPWYTRRRQPMPGYT